MNKEIEIPEGYEARIEGNKVILERKSDDERIRREILETLRYGLACEESVLMPGATTTLKEAIAYLERQKPMYNLEIPAGDVAPAEEESPFDEDEFLDGELSAFLQNYDKEYDDDAAVSDVARHFYEIGKKQKEQKPASGNSEKPNNHAEWSEEDETCLEYALWCVMKTRHFVAKDACDLDACRSAERWLKSLRPQPKQEWSETDKLHLNNAILVAKKEWGVNSYTARWLESLRDNCKKCNNHWKPSEEQMKALNAVANEGVLLDLFNDLLKLF